MPRRISSSQLRSKLRQLESRQRQAVQQYNSDVRTHNQKARRNRSELKRRIDAYNRSVRAYKSRVRANQARLRAALRGLSAQTVPVRYVPLRRSVESLSAAYTRLDSSDADPYLSDLAERDTANSVVVLNTLMVDTDSHLSTAADLTRTRISTTLESYSKDLRDRWTGAIFALNPNNPDAARHFCTSAREIAAKIIDTEAPDAEVFSWHPNCQITDHGTPTRHVKIAYCLDRSDLANDFLEDFIDTNTKDLSALFQDLNSGAHGPAGRYSLSQLVAIKTRVEDFIEFMCAIVS